jgi:transcriptional regulator with XRE-family HTH domain
MVNTNNFSERLNKIMIYYGLSASAFAELIQVQRSSISHILSGRNKPSLDFILKLNTAFTDINLYWLLNGTGEMLHTSTTPTSKKKLKTETSETPIVESKNTYSKNKSKDIERIIIFYKDGTFDKYSPE